jgi:FxLD family lantipeptide
MSTPAAPTLPTTPAATLDESDFDLDISLFEAGPIIPELMRSTSDNCGGTCASACTSCKS